MVRLAPPLQLLGAFLLAASCTSADAISIEEERAMGAEVADDALRQLPLVRDSAVRQCVSEIGHRLVRSADTTTRRYVFYVVDSPVANAFAVPGGFIFVNRGIIDMADEGSELAGVLAHEIGHVVRRHSLAQMAKAQNAQSAVSLIYTLLQRDPGLGEQIALHVAGTAWMAKHSRAAENEADRVGVHYLARAGIDPQGVPRFFRKLLDAERHSPALVAQWFGSHPLTEDRIADTDGFIARELPRDLLSGTQRDVPAFRRLKERMTQLPPPPEPAGRLPAAQVP